MISVPIPLSKSIISKILTVPTVKLSDDRGKNTGDSEEVRLCKEILQIKDTEEQDDN